MNPRDLYSLDSLTILKTIFIASTKKNYTKENMENHFVSNTKKKHIEYNKTKTALRY